MTKLVFRKFALLSVPKHKNCLVALTPVTSSPKLPRYARAMEIDPDEYTWYPVNLDPSAAILATAYQTASLLNNSGRVWRN